MATPILPSLAPGSQYQLIFVTSDTIDGNAGTEAPYNTLATTDAASLNTFLASAGITGVTWHAITSTADGVIASTNAPWGSVRVYNTQSQQVNNSSASLYSGALQNPVMYDQTGATAANTFPWTGSKASGTADSPLGSSSSSATFGSTSAVNTTWADFGFNPLFTTRSVYALSSVITVPVATPEPATITLLGSALLIFGAVQLRRRRSRA
jgi:hypothetical protein